MRVVGLLVVVACASNPATPATTPTGPAPSSTVDSPIDTVLAELAAHCRDHIEACRAHEEPESDWTPRPETDAFIQERRRRVETMGAVLVWDLGRHMTRTERDVLHIIGGMFSPDHLGPDVYEQILARAKANASAYVQMLLRVVGDTPDPVWLASLHVPHLLTVLREDTDVRAAARELLEVHEVVAATPPTDRDEYWSVRMEERVRWLRAHARGSD